MKKREIAFIIVIIIFLSFLLKTSAEDLPTKMEIPPVFQAPELYLPIPNQYLDINETFPNAINLYNHFRIMDGMTEELVFYATDTTDVDVTINSSGSVTLYAHDGFEGVDNVTFIASNHYFNVSSNIVFISVGNDTSPPTYSSIVRNQPLVYQNALVNFSTLWRDNFALGSFIFTIKQTSSWENFTQNFSGKENLSVYALQIRAPGGTLVYWKFFAYDKYGNMNVTPLQNFTVSEVTVPPVTIEPTTGEAAEGGAGAAPNDTYEEEEVVEIVEPQVIRAFSVEPDLIKLTLKQGDTSTRFIKITNIGSINISFVLTQKNIEGIELKLSDISFSLNPRESKTVALDFTLSKKIIPDLYFPSIEVRSEEEKKIVPIILEIKSLEPKIDVLVSIDPQDKNLRKSQIVHANVTIINLKDIKSQNISLITALKDVRGNILDTNQENILLTQNSITLPRNLSIPDGTKQGTYIFYARVISEEDSAIGIDTFVYGKRFNFLALIKTSNIIFLILLIAIILALFAVRYQRNRDRVRILNLYLMVNELKKEVDKGNMEKAIDIFIRIKEYYKEPVSKTMLENKEAVKEEMKKLILEMSQNMPKPIITKKEEEKKPVDAKVENKVEEKIPVDAKVENKVEEKIPVDAKVENKVEEKNEVKVENKVEEKNEVKVENKVEEKIPVDAKVENKPAINKPKMKKNKKIVHKNKNKKKGGKK